MIDFSELKGKKDRNNIIINDDRTLFRYLIYDAGLKLIMGSSIGFDTKDMIMRVTFALDRKDIVKYFEKLKDSIEGLR